MSSPDLALSPREHRCGSSSDLGGQVPSTAPSLPWGHRRAQLPRSTARSRGSAGSAARPSQAASGCRGGSRVAHPALQAGEQQRGWASRAVQLPPAQGTAAVGQIGRPAEVSSPFSGITHHKAHADSPRERRQACPTSSPRPTTHRPHSFRAPVRQPQLWDQLLCPRSCCLSHSHLAAPGVQQQQGRGKDTDQIGSGSVTRVPAQDFVTHPESASPRSLHAF